jgi:regulator of sigma E protease
VYIIIFIIILAVLVFVHELGHFLVAKAAGIRVDEFALGFPPKIVNFKRGETTYALNAIPFGGYVKIFGEDYEGGASDSSMPTDPRSFANKPKSIQALVLVAGIAFNIIFAGLLLTVGFMIGMPVSKDYNPELVKNPSTTILLVQKNSPAEAAGLKVGDRVYTLSSGTETIQNPSTSDLKNFTSTHDNQPVTFTYERGAEKKTVTITPTVRDGRDATIGVAMDAVGVLQLPVHKAVYEGVKFTGYLVSSTATGLWDLLLNAFKGSARLSDVTGPVGIAGLVKDSARLGFVYLISFTAIISINLAIINLIPFPALDGGRILFVLIEKIRGKALNQKWVQVVNASGLALLLLLMVVVTFKDVFALFR